MKSRDRERGPIKHVNEEKDLIIPSDNALNFSSHIAFKIKTTNRILGIIKGTYTRIDKSIFVQLYNSLSHLIWNMRAQSGFHVKIECDCVRVHPKMSNILQQKVERTWTLHHWIQEKTCSYNPSLQHKQDFQQRIFHNQQPTSERAGTI